MTTQIMCVILSLQHKKKEEDEQMTQPKEQTAKAAEFSTLFDSLDERGKESALCILKALDFAQSVMADLGEHGQHTAGSAT